MFNILFYFHYEGVAGRVEGEVEGGLAKHQTFYLIFLLKPFLSFEDGGCFDDHIKEKIGSDDVLKQHISWQRT